MAKVITDPIDILETIIGKLRSTETISEGVYKILKSCIDQIKEESEK